MRRMVLILGATLTLPAHAQLTAPVKTGDTTITVTGIREPKKLEMSNWLVAETPHVVVFKEAIFIKGDEQELRDTARNLEKLHFALSTLLNRVDAPDETIKTALFMIGRAGPFEQLKLTNLRWQYGPFPPQFEKVVYYDPREEGPVIGTTKDGVNIVLSPSRGRATNRNCDGNAGGPRVLPPVHVNYYIDSATGMPAADMNQMLSQMSVNEQAFCQSAESRLYAVFAQNYLMTYFPAAYPRWFLQGFGEVFGTLEAGDDYVEYGRIPPGYFEVMNHFGPYYPLERLLDGRYLSGKGPEWTPYHAWRLVHFLYFSDEWKSQLNDYLAAIARGDDLATAARAFGDLERLQKALSSHRKHKLGFERLEFPAELIPEPNIRRLTRAEAGLIQGRLELGARIELPPEDSADYAAALERRTAWIEQLRENARQFPNLIEHHLLLAEAECRTGNPEGCLASAERALEQSPNDTTALVWKGGALAQLAARAPANERQRLLKEARSVIVQANRKDLDGILPLIAYFDSFVVAGQKPHDSAVEGMAKVVHSSPAAPAPRLKLGQELIDRDLEDGARKTLLPVAHGAYDSPEKPAAAALLSETAESVR